ncbi:MAG: ABC transporter ATP-binding protein [Defluviitaleaceae bacterium]|nr:ABC transporter ATP-binding protein [Defluviitaleaceae bacterium]
MLRLEDVYYSYKSSNSGVLKNISASFYRGEFASIVGPSGSGKTTLLSIMAGLDKPTSGIVSIDETNLESMDLDKYRREQVSMIFQAFHLFPLLTALENVCYPLEMNKSATKATKAHAIELLKSVEINEEKHNRYPTNLSGGEQQRVAIARALSTGAKVILADEPTGNLDKANGESVVNILKKLAHEQNYAVIVVTHNLEIAEASDVVYRMSDGVLYEA